MITPNGPFASVTISPDEPYTSYGGKQPHILKVIKTDTNAYKNYPNYIWSFTDEEFPQLITNYGA